MPELANLYYHNDGCTMDDVQTHWSDKPIYSAILAGLAQQWLQNGIKAEPSTKVESRQLSNSTTFVANPKICSSAGGLLGQDD